MDAPFSQIRVSVGGRVGIGAGPGNGARRGTDVIAIAVAAIISLGSPIERLDGVTVPFCRLPGLRGNAAIIGCFLLQGGILLLFLLLRLLAGGLQIEDGRQIPRKGTLDVTIKDDLKIFRLLKLAKPGLAPRLRFRLIVD